MSESTQRIAAHVSEIMRVATVILLAIIGFLAAGVYTEVKDTSRNTQEMAVAFAALKGSVTSTIDEHTRQLAELGVQQKELEHRVSVVDSRVTTLESRLSFWPIRK